MGRQPREERAQAPLRAGGALQEGGGRRAAERGLDRDGEVRWRAHGLGPAARLHDSKRKNHFWPPPSFFALLPQDMKLDGELWAGRCRFAAVGSLMGSSPLEGGRWYETAWRSLTFVVFDAPHAGGTYLQRLEKARARIAATGPPDRRIVVAPVIQVADAAAKDALLQRVVARGGEGLVLRRNEARWRAGTSKGCGRGPQECALHRQPADCEGAGAQRAERRPVHHVRSVGQPRGTATLPTLPVGHHCHIPVQTDL
mmetsp:Transcript_40709/g.134712  ORF Transcript_40709/g.134712 Transcript_40709/m.134712 type:complete len:256 (-) Transcript_40709:225-992(-)